MKDRLILRVSKVIPETKDAITLVLENTEGKYIPYRAGQFLTFIFDFHGRELRRSYSLSSAPGIDSDLTVTIKRVQNGEISRYLFNYISTGSILNALLPAGRFTIIPGHTTLPRDVFLFGAGSGIVPLFSILKTVLDTEPHSLIHLIYSNHTESSIIFRKKLQELEEIYKDQFNYIHVLSNHKSGTPGIIHGHLNSSLLEDLLDKHLHFEKQLAVFYVCGPFAYMRMITITLPVLGFAQEQIYREAFLSEINESRPKIPGDNVNAKVKLLIGDKERKIIVPIGKTILRAALESGIALPYSCEAGICSTCLMRCIEGKIEMSVNEVLTENDIASGLVLTCTGYPVTAHVKLGL